MVKHLVLGLALGFVTIIFLYVMANAIISSESEINQINLTIVILGYGVASLVLGAIYDKIFPFGKKKK